MRLRLFREGWHSGGFENWSRRGLDEMGGLNRDKSYGRGKKRARDRRYLSAL